MPALSPLAIEELVREALVARVRVLLGQSGFDELLAVQERVSQQLAEGAAPLHGADAFEGSQALAQAVIDGLGLDAGYYGGSTLDYIVSEGLTSVGVVLSELVRGHERDRRTRWAAEVVPALERVALFTASVFDGRWARQAVRQSLHQLH